MSPDQSLSVLTDWDRIEDLLGTKDDASVSVITAVVAALQAPRAASLNDALSALETAVAGNDLGPQRLLASLIPRMIARQSGRILLVTYDPRSITHPEDAAARGSARGIFTYMESLRPALKLRGITAGMLLLAPSSGGTGDLTAYAEQVASAAAECVQKATLQRVLKIR